MLFSTDSEQPNIIRRSTVCPRCGAMVKAERMHLGGRSSAAAVDDAFDILHGRRHAHIYQFTANYDSDTLALLYIKYFIHPINYR